MRILTKTLHKAAGHELAFPDGYKWLLAAASFDVIMTWAVLSTGGSERNPLARYVLQMGGLGSLILFKCFCFLVTVAICEILHRRFSSAWARRILAAGIVVWSLLGLMAMVQLVAKITLAGDG